MQMTSEIHAVPLDENGTVYRVMLVLTTQVLSKSETIVTDLGVLDVDELPDEHEGLEVQKKPYSDLANYPKPEPDEES